MPDTSFTTEVRGPTDGAMISPFGAERDMTLGELAANAALERAALLAKRLLAELALAMSMHHGADDQLQDAFGWVKAMIGTEIPAAIRSINEAE